ncbi:Vps51/Vps67-domain-containing protein [Ampelomyces quisqualis]|uniref:Vacuolar protein sorting-associated protein 51 homolog n=1 Tax=Ampelomyces quisqualis TaxID=50730 RepID=A0A6A5QZ65_AMPQU|nr:Vps51/Vps67-domain-containing protein [Ampelomyces quisqualis]
MSTIASPRASVSVRSPSSTRTSFDSSRAPQPARRNRAALREFYGLKNAAQEGDAKISEESTRTELGPEDDETLTELDAADFDAQAFVDSLLAKEGLRGVLKVEANLISQIRNLDSDRKSLVYDNYSKLLSATSTIRRMRGNMDPLAPTTHTLGPAIAQIAETAASLSLSSMQSMPAKPDGLGIIVHVEDNASEKAAETEKQRQRNTVRWVLDTPRRLQDLIDQERDEAADQEWKEISQILAKWNHVPGVAELREQCEHIMK